MAICGGIFALVGMAYSSIRNTLSFLKEYNKQ